MGKPKIVKIDDSAPEADKKKKTSKEAVKQVQADAVNAELESSVEKDPIASLQDDTAKNKAEAKPEETTEPKKAAKKTKTSKAAAKKEKTVKKVRSKKYLEAAEKVEKEKLYPLDEAIELAKATSYTKFAGSLEVHMRLAVKGTRGLVTLPYASGKKLTILAFGKDAENSGADIVGTDEMVAAIEKGKINFDVVVTTPQWMPKLARVARVLGPRGLMPNPKSGTVTDNLSKAVEELQAGKTEYKAEKDAPVIHLKLGSLSQPTEELSANLRALYTSIGKSRIKKITVAPTMGIGVRINPVSVS